MLCSLCQKIDFMKYNLVLDPDPGYVTWETLDDWDGPHKSAEYYAYGHHPTINCLRVSAIDGCHLCTMILRELGRISGERLQGSIELRVYRRAGEEWNVKDIIAVARTPGRDVKIPLDYVGYNTSMTTLLDEKAAKVAFSTGNDDNVKLAMIWLNRCLKSHVACTISTNPLAPLPTRVLDVASDTHDSIRLLRYHYNKINVE